MRPESNVNLQNDMILLDQKKDKCVEVIKTSGAIHELLAKFRHEEHMQAYNLEPSAVV